MVFLTICLIQSTNKTRAGGLLRQYEYEHMKHTYALRSIHVQMFLPRKLVPSTKCIFVFLQLIHSAGFHKKDIKAPPKFLSLISFQFGNWPLGYMLGARGLEGCICSGIIYSALLFL